MRCPVFLDLMLRHIAEEQLPHVRIIFKSVLIRG